MKGCYVTEDGSRYVVWYEDAQSVTDKIRPARLFGITGVSLRRIGNLPACSNYDMRPAVRALR